MTYIGENNNIEGILKNYDIDPKTPLYNETYGIFYRWDCFDLNDDLKPCTDKYETPLLMDSLDFELPKYSMKPYNAYSFTLNVTTGKKNSILYRSY